MTRTRQILFIQGGGAGAHDVWDGKLVESLRRELGGGYEVRYPPPEMLRDQLLKVHGVSIYITTRLPRPLPAMIRTWIRANQDEDLPGSLTALENALASRQQKRLTARY